MFDISGYVLEGFLSRFIQLLLPNKSISRVPTKPDPPIKQIFLEDLNYFRNLFKEGGYKDFFIEFESVISTISSHNTFFFI